MTEWIEKNGGKIQKLSDKKIIEEKKVLLLELSFLVMENVIMIVFGNVKDAIKCAFEIIDLWRIKYGFGK